MIREPELFSDLVERRDYIQILADIITVCEEPSRITRILRLANVQYNTMRDAMESLTKSGLMRKKRSSTRDERSKIELEATDLGLNWRDIVRLVYMMLYCLETEV